MDFAVVEKLIETHPVAVGLGAVWVMIWKGLALWKAAERRERLWFTAIFIINTLGLLEIIYLFFISPRANNDSTKSTESA